MSVLPRRTGIASVAALAGITLTVGLAHAVAPEWSRSAGLDVWNFAPLAAEYHESQERGEELDSVQDQMNRQIAASEHVVMLLVDDQLPLPAAVDELDRITRDRPSFADALAHVHPDAPTHRHRLVRYALDKVGRRLADDPSKLAEVTARLEAAARQLPE